MLPIEIKLIRCSEMSKFKQIDIYYNVKQLLLFSPDNKEIKINYISITAWFEKNEIEDDVFFEGLATCWVNSI